jgi:hypothetical protein
VENIGILIDYAFHHPDDVEKRNKWHHLCNKFAEAMEILLLRHEYADEEKE